MAYFIASYKVSWKHTWEEYDHFSGAAGMRYCESPGSEEKNKAFDAESHEQALAIALKYRLVLIKEKKTEIINNRGRNFNNASTTLDVLILGIEKHENVKIPKDISLCRSEF